jgi:hypothetical protein
VNEQEYRCVNSKCKKIITKNNSYISKNDDNFNGQMVWCKQCVQNKFDDYFHEYNNIRKALFLVCRRFNIPFIEDKFVMTDNHLQEKKFPADKALGYYMQKVYTLHYNGEKCFDDGMTDLFQDNFNNIDGEENRVKKWGNFGTEDLDFLDYELEDWQKTHSCENKAELTLLKLICIKELDIRKMIEAHQDTSKALKDLQDLMKTASVDPAKANVAGAGKSLDCFGVWVKDIEEKRPAEWYEDQDKYKDIDGFGTYLKNYVYRPIENFLTGNRNFFVDDNIDADLDNIKIDTEDDFDGS